MSRALIWSLLLCLLPGPALAQEAGEGEGPAAEAAGADPGSQPENAQASDQARAHFVEGIGAFEAHRYRDAIRAFSLAAQLVPSADLWFNIARAHEELSEYDLAIEHYQRYLRDRVDPPDREQVEAHIARLGARAEAERARQLARPTHGELRLTTSRSGADVQLDGASAGESPWSEPREIEAGRHGLSVSSEGFIPFHSELSVEPGMTTAAYADLVPETRYRTIGGDRIFTWIAFGLAAVSLGATIGLGVEAISRATQPEQLSWAAYSDGALAATIGLGILGVVLYFAEGAAVHTEQITVDDDAQPILRGAPQ